MTSKLSFPNQSSFNQLLSLRISDINYGQHLGHDTLVSLFHDARCQWLASQGLTELTLDGQNLGWVVASLEVNYLAEAFYADKLETQLTCAEIGSKSCTLYQQLVRVTDKQVIAIAKVVQVFFDYQSKTAQPVPELFKQLVAQT